MPAYRRLCQEQTDKLDAAPFPLLAANNAVWLACLFPDAAKDYQKLVALSARTVREAANPKDRTVYLNTLGAICYRAG